MAVYKKTYRPYAGALTPSWSRFLVIPRYAFDDLHKSRFLNTFFALSFAYPLIAALLIYVEYNASALGIVGARNANQLIDINVVFFLNFLGWQAMLGLFLASFIGPSQISPDVANNALSLYMARPFSRVEYVLGKMSVLAVLLSLMTWVPGLLLFGLKGYFAGSQWMSDHWRYAAGVFFGSWIWILIVSLLALALSAWVKWKPAAGGLMFGVFFVAAAFGAIINGVQRTNWGSIFNVGYLVGSVWVQMFEGSNQTSTGAVFFRSPSESALPMWCSWMGIAALCAVCLYMLARKIRGAEVVR